MHTCHISHCEIKSHRIWPIWKAIPIKKNQISQNFQTILQQKQNSHTAVVFTSFLHGKQNTFDYIGGRSKVMFKKISQNFVKSPLKNLPYLKDFRPQLMACNYVLEMQLKLLHLETTCTGMYNKCPKTHHAIFFRHKFCCCFLCLKNIPQNT